MPASEEQHGTCPTRASLGPMPCPGRAGAQRTLRGRLTRALCSPSWACVPSGQASRGGSWEGEPAQVCMPSTISTGAWEPAWQCCALQTCKGAWLCPAQCLRLQGRGATDAQEASQPAAQFQSPWMGPMERAWQPLCLAGIRARDSQSQGAVTSTQKWGILLSGTSRAPCSPATDGGSRNLRAWGEATEKEPQQAPFPPGAPRPASLLELLCGTGPPGPSPHASSRV